jgi:hypothetical protein
VCGAATKTGSGRVGSGRVCAGGGVRAGGALSHGMRGRDMAGAGNRFTPAGGGYSTPVGCNSCPVWVFEFG